MLTVKEIMKWRPCYTRAAVQRLVGKGITLQELLLLDIFSEDRLWVAWNYLANHDQHLLDCWFYSILERAVRTHVLDSNIPAARLWGQKWLDGDHAVRDVKAIQSVKDIVMGREGCASWPSAVAALDAAECWLVQDLHGVGICAGEAAWQSEYNRTKGLMLAKKAEEEEWEWQIATLLEML